MGGEWDSTNVADGDVAVFSHRSGSTTSSLLGRHDRRDRPRRRLASSSPLRAFRRAALQRSPRQWTNCCEQLRARRSRTRGRGRRISGCWMLDSRSAVSSSTFGVAPASTASFFLPLLRRAPGAERRGCHRGSRVVLGRRHATARRRTWIAEGLATATSSPGRLRAHRDRAERCSVDAAHNPHGAQALARAITDSFDFTSLVGVVGVLADKDAAGDAGCAGSRASTASS